MEHEAEPSAPAGVVYGVCVGNDATFGLYAEPSIRRIDPAARILTRTHQTSICRAYNSIIGEALALDAEILVLLHEDIELLDPDFLGKLSAAFDRPEVALVGVIGGRDVPDMAWWEGERVGYAPDNVRAEQYPNVEGDVEQLDGILIAMSRWAMGNLRFDDRTFPGFHGYDADISRQAQAAQKGVKVAAIALKHHNQSQSGDSHEFLAALYAFRRKWRRGTEREKALWRLKRLLHLLLAKSGHRRRPRPARAV